MFKKIVLILIILCSLNFYEFVFVPDILVKVSDWIGIALIAGFTILLVVYGNESPIKKHFIIPIILILISVLISMFGALAFQDQSFLLTAYAQRAIYFYLIYFLLHFGRFSGQFIIRILISFGLIYIFLYIIQLSLYPLLITNSKIFMDRGTIRIFLEGAGYLVIGYLIWLYLSFRDYKVKQFIFILLSFAVFILMGTRQVIATMFLLTILFIVQTRLIKKKFFAFILIGVAFIPLFILFQDVLYAMLDVTRRQSENVEANIRLESARYFLTDFFTNKWAYFTGNGAAGKSQYALRMIRLAEKYGYYQSDVGLIGEYSKYGILFVVGVFIILYKALKTRLPEGLLFIKYNFLGIILTLVTGGGAFGNSGTNILINCMLLYLIDLYKHDSSAFDSYLGKNTVK